MAFLAFTYGDPKVGNTSLNAVAAFLFGLSLGGTATPPSNSGWCG